MLNLKFNADICAQNFTTWESSILPYSSSITPFAIDHTQLKEPTWSILCSIFLQGVINFTFHQRQRNDQCCGSMSHIWRKLLPESNVPRLSRKMIWKGEEWHVFDKFLQKYLWGNWNPFISIELWVLDFSIDFVQTIVSSANCKFPDIILDLFWEILSY